MDGLQAMRLAPSGIAEPVGVHALNATLLACATEQVPLMVFVGNPGCVQIILHVRRDRWEALLDRVCAQADSGRRP